MEGITDEDVIPILVPHYLVPHNNRSLQKLEFSCFGFQHEYLCHLLHVGMNANCPQLTMLVFEYCMFNNDATQVLMDYIRRVDDSGGCCVERLHFGPSESVFTGRSDDDGQVFAALLSTTPLRGRQQQQQQQQHLLDELQMRDGTEFFQIILSSSNGEYRVPRCIRLAMLSGSAWEQIQRYLLIHAIDLHELIVCGPMDANIESQAIVDTIRRNGSLHSVTMERTDEYRQSAPMNIFSPVELRLIDAYCRRNQQMSKKCSIVSSDGSSSLLSLSLPNNRHTSHVVAEEMMLQCVVPTYFNVVCDARRTAPTAMLQMLLAMGDPIISNGAQ